MSLDPWFLFGSILFGLIGFAAFRYGRKQSSLRHMLIAVALMGFPYFVSENWQVYGVGGLLSFFLFWP